MSAKCQIVQLFDDLLAIVLRAQARWSCIDRAQHRVATQSVKNDKMMSAYMSEFVSFNVLDADYVNAKLADKILLNDPVSKEDLIPSKEGTIELKEVVLEETKP